MCAAARSTARTQWVKMINLSIYWYPPGPHYRRCAPEEPRTHWSARGMRRDCGVRAEANSDGAVQGIINTEGLEKGLAFLLIVASNLTDIYLVTNLLKKCTQNTIRRAGFCGNVWYSNSPEDWPNKSKINSIKDRIQQILSSIYQKINKLKKS